MTEARPAGPDSARIPVDQTLAQLRELVENARNLPMSTSVRVERDELLDLIDEVATQLPDELRAARWLLKERDEFRAKTRREADEIINDAKSRVAHMVEKSEVVKASQLRSQELVDQSTTETNRMKREAEDYCDQKLASFEVVLEQIGQRVAAGRQRLAGTVEQRELAEPVADRPNIDHDLD
jgi:cell division septum initiation protein DivIVA